jgi:class 3 adenylate cyclase
VAIFSEHSVFGEDQDLGFSRDQLTEQERLSLMCQQARFAAEELQERLLTMRSDDRKVVDAVAPESSSQVNDGNFTSSASMVHGELVPHVGIGLHYGDCTYGNVGAPRRLDFTVIGPSVNLASRVESLCSKLGADVLATEAFAECDSGKCKVADAENRWMLRGNHNVKGFTDPITVYELNSVRSAERDDVL